METCLFQRQRACFGSHTLIHLVCHSFFVKDLSLDTRYKTRALPLFLWSRKWENSVLLDTRNDSWLSTKLSQNVGGLGFYHMKCSSLKLQDLWSSLVSIVGVGEWQLSRNSGIFDVLWYLTALIRLETPGFFCMHFDRNVKIDAQCLFHLWVVVLSLWNKNLNLESAQSCFLIHLPIQKDTFVKKNVCKNTWLSWIFLIRCFAGNLTMNWPLQFYMDWPKQCSLLSASWNMQICLLCIWGHDWVKLKL